MPTILTTDAQVLEEVHRMTEYRNGEGQRLERIFLYLRDPDIQESIRYSGSLTNGPLRWLAKGVPDEVKRLAEMSRVNMLKYVVNATTQGMFVDGFRAPKSDVEEPAWLTWQLNRMDSRQIGVHRSALSYGASYAIVLPGDPVPTIRGASPRRLTAVYGDDDDWPELALEARRSARKSVQLYRLYDAVSSFWVEVPTEGGSGKPKIIKRETHDVGYCPVVRFVCTVDDDDCIEGEVEPLIALQDQINVTTFGLLVAQHHSAFRQRYIMGWTAEDEEAGLSATARKVWAFEDEEVKVGEFSQTDLSGYIDSREATLRHLATTSQTPAHELLGQLVNLSAEALAAAERSHRAKVAERQMTFGEAWKQVLSTVAKINRDTSDPLAQIRWQDTEARSLSSVADALGKLVTGLGVPPQELWGRIPGVTQSDVERWKAAAAQEDAISQLNATLDRQSNPTPVSAA